MTLRAGRRIVHLGSAALLGWGGFALPAAAQSYLADNGNGSVTVDYGVLGGAPGNAPGGAMPATPVGNVARGALPAGSCSCANAPLGVIAAAPRPTFTNPFGANLAMSAPTVPPGFMTFNQAVGSGGGTGTRVVLKAPNASTDMASAAPVMEEPSTASNAASLPASTPTQSGEATGEEPTAALPATTPTQSGGATAGTTPSAPAEATTATPPAQPEEMPQSVPSPVQPQEQQPAAAAPEAPASTETQTAEAAPQPEATPQPEAKAAETPPEAPAATPPATPAENTQEASVTPPAPAAGAAAPAADSGALPAGATRILYTGETDDVPGPATAELDKLAQEMQGNENMRVQVMAYAAGTEDTESKARRKSLARGLAVRSYLIKAGIPSTRIDVRALGAQAGGGPADRVDIIPAS